MDLNLKSKYALITGSSCGIGRAIAIALADEGCNVCICARGEKWLKFTEAKLRDRKVEVLSICDDVTLIQGVKHVMDNIQHTWGKLDILVNNVGGGGRWGTLDYENTPEKTWEEVYHKNAGTAIRFTMAAIPLMLKNKWGRVISIVSVHGLSGYGGRPWFCMAKSAEISLMNSLSSDNRLVSAGITFNNIR